MLSKDDIDIATNAWGYIQETKEAIQAIVRYYFIVILNRPY